MTIILLSFNVELNASVQNVADTTSFIENSDTNYSEAHNLPDVFMVIPFITLLLIIATGPLFYRHFFEKNYAIISIVLGSITVGYYLFILRDSHTVLHTLDEYISFIALLGSLFVAAGGILIKVDRKATPMLNSLIFFIRCSYSKRYRYYWCINVVDKTILKIE
ncbi:MAG: sodium:proton antiporter [Ignavibacteriaceae bacterium]|nr:sodium:proton antiporter [Ignavibacteriaceae bacterium]